ncbi:MAG: sugar transferase [Lentimicrobium sp.]|jgi:exopolysaccharide biosynthesis polyprenyl glycosylphosphotransferase|nr:sugar transferase [Lentimicrobium sp.]
MIREREDLGSRLFGVLITALTLFAFFAAYLIVYSNSGTEMKYDSHYFTVVLLIIPIWYYGIQKTNLTRFYGVKDFSIIFLESGLFIISSTGILAALSILFKLNNVDLSIFLVFALINFVLLTLLISFAYLYHRSMMKKGMNARNVIVVADDNCVNFIEGLFVHKEWGYQVMAIISESELIYEIFGSRVKIIEESRNLPNLIKNMVVDEVLYCRNDINQNEIRSLIYACEEIGVIFRLQSAFFKMPSTKAHLSYYDEIPFLTFINTPTNKLTHQWKFVVDMLASFFIILIWSPVLLLIALAIKVTSKGPIIFKQKRVGLRGREFNIYKFRTMVQDAEKLKARLAKQNEMDGPVFKMKNDPRITKIGKILRKTGLDEVPQFFNVLKGDMSLVGPRPPLPSEVEQYERWQLRRLSMRPGITCIWQIAPNRNSISFEEWMKLDLQYIDTWSLKIDFILLIRTIRTVARGSGQ